jgi:hypothetical protein
LPRPDKSGLAMTIRFARPFRPWPSPPVPARLIPYFCFLTITNSGIEASSMATENMTRYVIECP